MKLVDKPDLGSGAERRMGSIPFARTRGLLHLRMSLFYFYNSLNICPIYESTNQRKIPVVLFSVSPAQSMRSEPFGVARAACFEELAGVFASSGALHYAKILASLKMKNGISLTPLNCALKAFTFALNDSADAFVERLSK